MPAHSVRALVAFVHQMEEVKSLASQACQHFGVHWCLEAAVRLTAKKPLVWMQQPCRSSEPNHRRLLQVAAAQVQRAACVATQTRVGSLHHLDWRAIAFGKVHVHLWVVVVVVRWVEVPNAHSKHRHAEESIRPRHPVLKRAAVVQVQAASAQAV